MNHKWRGKIVALGLVTALAPGSAAWAQDTIRQDSDVMAAMTDSVARRLAAQPEQMSTTSGAGRFKVVTTLKLEMSAGQTASGSKAGRKAAYGIGFGLAGMFGGLLVGATLGKSFDRNCGCDDPGLAAAVYGMPIGAIAGATFGVWLGGR
jgi:hypothetical protein